MPLSDTQRLIATLELQDKFSGTAGRANRSLGDLEGRLGRTGRSLGVFGHAAGTALGIGLERAISGGVRLLTSAITGGVEALNQLESSMVATETVIASTQGVAGQTASEIREMSEAFESLNATVGDEVIQAGANMLLTFTKIREDAFEPALEAALNMNEAMGRGPEGLQQTIIQVGRALNDPIRGITALSRAGVTFDDETRERIELLIEQNDLYGAQRVILDELTTEFGGRFAAAGKTATGQQAALRDRIEDLQKALAGPLIPAIDKVRTRLITLFESPAAVAAATKLGDTIAGLFTEENLGRAVDVIDDGLRTLANFDFNTIGDGVQKVFGFLGEVPWGAIGEGLRITGQATKIVVDAFLALPKEVQGIAIAALAVNKLSGGLGGSLVGAGGRGLIDLFRGRGTTPANPLFVADVAGGGRGPGFKLPDWVAVAAAWAARAAKATSPALLLSGSNNVSAEQNNRMLTLTRQIEEGAITSAEAARLWSKAYGEIIANPFRVDITSGGKKFGTGTSEWAQGLNGVTKATGTSDWARGLNKIEAVLPDTAMSPVTQGVAGQTAELVRTRAELSAKLGAVGSKQEQVAAAVRSQSGVLGQIRDKTTQVKVNVQNNVQVGVSEIQYRIQSVTQSITGTTTPTSPVAI